jgi:hypothetical protein
MENNMKKGQGKVKEKSDGSPRKKKKNSSKM